MHGALLEKQILEGITMRFVLLLVVGVTGTFGQTPKSEPRQATLAQQKMCADQAKKFYNEPDFKSKDFTEYTSHYDPRMNVCYVMIRSDLHIGKHSVAFQIFDAFEGTERAHMQMQVEGPISEQQPYACSVKPIGQKEIYCKTEEEFDNLIKKHFGMERP